MQSIWSTDKSVWASFNLPPGADLHVRPPACFTRRHSSKNSDSNQIPGYSKNRWALRKIRRKIISVSNNTSVTMSTQCGWDESVENSVLFEFSLKARNAHPNCLSDDVLAQYGGPQWELFFKHFSLNVQCSALTMRSAYCKKAFKNKSEKLQQF